ncbi:retrotransposon protein, putative, ty1-copia subclass [Tanacetum coccineum]|uniref:Retrotransposon protein, putative, ty1-copia subclass n=1 Tax=Tanacetum coccineum TaxID=301880 RepID=A0ABQ5H006_9ASTR
MMKRIVENTHGHPLKDQKFSKMDKVPLCTSCSLRKSIVRPSPLKVKNESPMFLERIQGDICGPIHPPCRPFRYFMVLIDASSRWSHVSLLSTRNVAFAKFLAQIIKLRAHFPDYIVKRCMYPLHHHNAQKWVLKGDWEFMFGFEYTSIIRYVEPLTSDVFTARFADCHFNEAIFPSLASDIMSGDDDPEPKSVIDCQSRPDWGKWKDAMQAELNSLNKRKVFRPIVTTPRDVKPIGCRWIFVQKRNEKNEVTRYKARLVAQGFSQRLGIDYEKTYSLVMDAITFRYLISLTVSRNLEMRLMDVVTAYLYGSIDNDIYMKIPEGFKIPKSLSSKPKEIDENVLGPELICLQDSVHLLHKRHGMEKKIITAIFRYLRGTTDLGLFYSNNSKQGLVGYADAGYLSDPHKARSQTGYVFLNGGTAISWRSQKQTLVATSSNHAEVIALHEARRECVWLRSMTQLIVTSYGLNN